MKNYKNNTIPISNNQNKIISNNKLRQINFKMN